MPVLKKSAVMRKFIGFYFTGNVPITQLLKRSYAGMGCVTCEENSFSFFLFVSFIDVFNCDFTQNFTVAALQYRLSK